MSGVDKIKAVAEEVAGMTREVVGKLTGNEFMEAEGVAEQEYAELKLETDDEEDSDEG